MHLPVGEVLEKLGSKPDGQVLEKYKARKFFTLHFQADKKLYYF
jgi:hypothetical protein